MPMFLQSKLLETRQLEARDPYPASYLVSVLDGTDTLHLIASEDVFSQLEEVEELTEVLLELRWRRIDLTALGGSGKGKAYRLSAVGLASGVS